MIYTVTLNPLMDVSLEVKELIYDDENKVEQVRKYPRGKGIDISRVIKELGGQSIALGFVGGYSGLELTGRLVKEGIISSFTTIREETRSHVTIYQMQKKLQTLLSTPCPRVDLTEADEFFRKISDIPPGSYVVLSGNIPPGLPDSFYAQLVTTLKERKTMVFLDSDEEALRQGTGAGPFLIKPNIHEFSRLVGRSLSEVAEVVEYAAPLKENVTYVVVSLGARGVVGISKGGNYHVIPPRVQVRNFVGAGDSLLAGIIFAFSLGASFESALRLGVACGTSSALNPGNVPCAVESIEAIKKDVRIEII